MIDSVASPEWGAGQTKFQSYDNQRRPAETRIRPHLADYRCQRNIFLPHDDRHRIHTTKSQQAFGRLGRQLADKGLDLFGTQRLR